LKTNQLKYYQLYCTKALSKLLFKTAIVKAVRQKNAFNFSILNFSPLYLKTSLSLSTIAVGLRKSHDFYLKESLLFGKCANS